MPAGSSQRRALAPRARNRRMHVAQPEYDAPYARIADASDNGSRHPARYGQNDREMALNRKNALFAGSDGGGEHWATIASLIETCRLCDVEPHAYLTDVISRIVNNHPNTRIDELLPWAYANTQKLKDVA